MTDGLRPKLARGQCKNKTKNIELPKFPLF